MRKKPAEQFSGLVDLTQKLAQRLESGWPSEAADAIDRLRQQYAAAISRPVSFSDVCDQIAQTFVCLLAAWSVVPRGLRQAHARRWLIHQAHPLWRELLSVASCTEPSQDRRLWNVLPIGDIVESFRDAHGLPTAITNGRDPDDPLAHLFERFLAEYKSADRRRWGVFFTPLPIVTAMIRNVDRLLVEHFDMANGLGDLAARQDQSGHEAARILDPAAGSGAFLAEVVRAAHENFRRSSSMAQDSKPADKVWPAALRRLMPKLAGYDVLIPACALAQLVIATRLLATGFDFCFQTPLPLNVIPHNTLAGPTGPTFAEPGSLPRPEFMIVVGNPPFSGISANHEQWAADLLRGAAPDDPLARNYFQSQGRPLGERKVWLNDDYVKFFRYAQWQVEQAGRGLIAFVSNHAYLDNATFRGMRESLLQSFPHIAILDLHGNLKRRERADGGLDENVFAIEQGVSIGYFVRTSNPANNAYNTVRRGDMWGTAAQKFKELAEEDQRIPLRRIRPRAPHFLFSREARPGQRLPRGIALNEVLPVHCTAPITARDHFIVALEREELLVRLREFADHTIDDATIRERYFRRTRSRHYTAGDTRGWKLTDARRRLALCAELVDYIQLCSYRPFDSRYVFWTDWMIDWPRPQLTRQAMIAGNWFLISRRQMLPDAPANFFWIADRIALDGVIRSDNRGSETLFPIYELDGKNARANFDSQFVSHWTSSFNYTWLERGEGDLSSTLGPEDLADFIYALFWSSAFRDAYADAFCSGYPRVLFARQLDTFQQMVRLGRQLRRHHLLVQSENGPLSKSRFFAHTDERVVGRSFPKFRNNTIWINSGAGFADVSEEAWTFTVGAHQVCRKWLIARRGRALCDHNVQYFERVVASIDATHRLVSKLDATIIAAGGLAKAFA